MTRISLWFDNTNNLIVRVVKCMIKCFIFNTIIYKHITRLLRIFTFGIFCLIKMLMMFILLFLKVDI